MAHCPNTITISRGSDWTVSLAFKDENDAPVEYMGASLTAEILSNVDDNIIVTPMAVWTDATQSEASLTLTENETPDVPVGSLSRLRITTVTGSGTTKIWPTALVEGVG